jgi:hypothetical protein
MRCELIHSTFDTFDNFFGSETLARRSLDFVTKTVPRRLSKSGRLPEWVLFYGRASVLPRGC